MVRPSKQEIEKIFREIEQKYAIKEGVLSEIYNAEARVVFLGKRRNIISILRKNVQDALKNGGGGDSEN